MTSSLRPPRGEARHLEVALAEEIERLPGVVAAAIQLDPDAELREVYIAATPDTAVPTLRQAAAEALSHHGYAVTPDLIRVGRIDEPPPPLAPQAPEPTSGAPAAEQQEPPAVPGRFLILESVEIETAGKHIQCTVRLVRHGEPLEGSYRELDTELGRARAAARATLAASEKASPSALGLEGAAIVEIFGRRYVIVSVEATAARRFVNLVGILALDASRPIEEAAALATLRAIERFISW